MKKKSRNRTHKINDLQKMLSVYRQTPDIFLYLFIFFFFCAVSNLSSVFVSWVLVLVSVLSIPITGFSPCSLHSFRLLIWKMQHIRWLLAVRSCCRALLIGGEKVILMNKSAIKWMRVSGIIILFGWSVNSTNHPTRIEINTRHDFEIH